MLKALRSDGLAAGAQPASILSPGPIRATPARARAWASAGWQYIATVPSLSTTPSGLTIPWWPPQDRGIEGPSGPGRHAGMHLLEAADRLRDQAVFVGDRQRPAGCAAALNQPQTWGRQEPQEPESMGSATVER